MRVTVIGTGYVGLVTGTCLANLGNEVICLDIDKKKIENLKKGILPIYEPGLKEILDRNAHEQRLSFTTNTKNAVQASEIIMIAVGTPQDKDGRADLSYVEQAAVDIGMYMTDEKVIVTKSTVPVGTNYWIKRVIHENLKKQVIFHVASNPEFLREGKAVRDFTNPDRVVIGTDSSYAKEKLVELYKPLERTGKPIVLTDIPTAELIKYASNAMLATRISFMNLLSGLCEKVGADVKMVAKGMGLDNRIGPRFLQAGCGYGGSCFPKDVQALIATLKEHSMDPTLFKEVEQINERYKVVCVEKMRVLLGSLDKKRIGILGLSFKPETDDMRSAPSVEIINHLKEEGVQVVAFDPIAMPKAKEQIEGIQFVDSPEMVFKNADGVILITEWDEFRALDLDRLKELMKTPCFVDGRNIYEPEEMKRAGFRYESIGRGTDYAIEDADYQHLKELLKKSICSCTGMTSCQMKEGGLSRTSKVWILA